jgi:peroxiredoxin
MDSGLALALVLPWAAVALLGGLVYVAMQQYGHALHARDDLSGRLSEVERALRDLTAQLAALRAGQADPNAGHRHDQPPSAPQGLALGTNAPDFALTDLDGRVHTLGDFSGRPSLVVFFSPTCGFCEQMAPRLGQLAQDGPRVLVIGQGDADAYRTLVAKHHWQCEVLLDPSANVAASYQYRGTPTGYLLDAQGRVASNLAIGADNLLGLLSAAPALPSTNGHAKDRVEILSAESVVAAKHR